MWILLTGKAIIQLQALCHNCAVVASEKWLSASTNGLGRQVIPKPFVHHPHPRILSSAHKELGRAAPEQQVRDAAEDHEVRDELLRLPNADRHV